MSAPCAPAAAAPPSSPSYPRLASDLPPLLPTPGSISPCFAPIGATVPLPPVLGAVAGVGPFRPSHLLHWCCRQLWRVGLASLVMLWAPAPPPGRVDSQQLNAATR